MKKSFFLGIIFLVLSTVASAQKNIKPKFTSINQFGIVWGATDDALQLQTINGFSYKTWSAGVGIGLDYYLERTVPLFLDLRKSVFSRKQTPFIYADMGVSMPWVKANKDVTWYSSDYSHGLYYDLGVGYKLPIHKNLNGSVSFGYTQKKLREERKNEMMFFDFSPYGHNSIEHYNYTLRRFSLKLGVIF